jgi:putative addiction module component (TIGR02574 family)
MPSDQLVEQLMALPLSERVDLAQALWQSIGEGPLVDAADEEREAVEQAHRRDADLTSGTVVGRSHEQVMQAARRALGCG